MICGPHPYCSGCVQNSSIFIKQEAGLLIKRLCAGIAGMWQPNHKDPLEALTTGLHGEQLKPVPANSHQVPKSSVNNILSPAPAKPSNEEGGSR